MPSIERAACPNRSCPDYGKRGGANVLPIGSSAGGRRQRLRCTTCRTRFVPTHGTFMYRLRITEETFLDAVMLHYGGYASRRIAGRIGVSPGTVLRVLDRAARYAEQVKLALVRSGRAPQDVADRLAELIRWRAATRTGGPGSAGGSRRGSLGALVGAWRGEKPEALLAAIHRLREGAPGTG